MIKLALLPFGYTGSQSVDKYLVDGFRGVLISRLSKLKNIVIIPIESYYFKDCNNLQTIISEINVDYFFEGQIVGFPPKARLDVRLINVLEKSVVWAESFQFLVKHLADIQIQIAIKINESLNNKLTSIEEVEILKNYTPDPKAFEYFLLGQGHVVSNIETNTEIALNMFNKAIFIDPKFAEAYAYKGYTLWRKYFCGWGADIAYLDEALKNIQKAKDIKPDSSSAQMSYIRVCWDLGLHENALKEGVEILKQKPSDLEAILAVARAFNNSGMADISIKFTKKILSIDKKNITAKKLLIWNYLMLKDYKSAIKTSVDYLFQNPNDSNTLWAIATAYFYDGKYDESLKMIKQGILSNHSDFALWLLKSYLYLSRANPTPLKKTLKEGIEAIEYLIKDFPKNYRAKAWLSYFYALNGDVDHAKNLCEEILSNNPNNGYLLYKISGAYAECNEVDLSIRILKRAIDSGFMSIQLLECEERTTFRNICNLNDYKKILYSFNIKMNFVKEKYSSILKEHLPIIDN